MISNWDLLTKIKVDIGINKKSKMTSSSKIKRSVYIFEVYTTKVNHGYILIRTKKRSDDNLLKTFNHES